MLFHTTKASEGTYHQAGLQQDLGEKGWLVGMMGTIQAQSRMEWPGVGLVLGFQASKDIRLSLEFGELSFFI